MPFSAVQAIDAVGSRVRQLLAGEQVELVGRADPQHLCNRLLRDSDVVVRYLTDGPATWRVAVTRRPPE